jgi:hypothetical protein
LEWWLAHFRAWFNGYLWRFLAHLARVAAS